MQQIGGSIILAIVVVALGLAALSWIRSMEDHGEPYEAPRLRDRGQ